MPPGYDSLEPLALGGTNEPENLSAAHVDCHAGKSRAEIKIVRKADRQMKAAVGIKTSRNPLPGSKRSKWKRKMDGTLVRR